MKLGSLYEKIVVTKGIVEVWRYEKLNVNSGGVREGDGADTEHNYHQRQRMRRNRIRQLICANFDSGSKFVTLTFDNNRDFDICNVQACNAFFKLFAKRLRYRYPDLQYVAVIEFQRRGAVHYHMICNLPFVKKAELARIWRGGFVKINAIDHVDNVGAYVIKYMCKDTEDRRLCGENAYLHSRTLAEPVTVKSWEENNTSVVFDLDDLLRTKEPSYSAKYESSNAGKIEYYQYNLNRDTTQVLFG